MDISARKGDLIQQPCDVLVVGAFLGVKELAGASGAVNEALTGDLAKFMKEDAFKAKLGATFVMRTNGKIPAKRVLVVGLGKKEEFDLEAIRQAAAASLNVSSLSGEVCCFRAPWFWHHSTGSWPGGGLKPTDCAQAIVEGVRLADYTFDTYRSAKKEKETREPIRCGDA